MSWSRAGITAALSLTLLGGCRGAAREILEEVTKEASKDTSQETYDPDAPSEPFEVVWSNDGKFQVPGEPEQYADISVHEGMYKVTLHGMPEGSLFVVGDKSNRIDSAVYDMIEVQDMTSRLGKVKISELSSASLAPGLSAELKLPGRHAKFELPAARVLGLDDLLEKVENGPVLFEGEQAQDEVASEAEKYSILLLSGLTPKAFGKASLLEDIDGIAVVRRLEAVKGTKTCSGYKDKNDKPVPDITLQLKETEVVIYDRRSGDAYAKQVFAPNEDCPMMTFGSKDDRTTDSSYPTRQIEEWVRSQAKR